MQSRKEIEELIDIIKNVMNVDITKKTNERIYVDGRMVFSKILTDRANADKNIRILEPTAGYGALVNAVVKARNAHGMNQGYTIEMIEMNPDSRLVLQAAQDELKGVMSLQEQQTF